MKQTITITLEVNNDNKLDVGVECDIPLCNKQEDFDEMTEQEQILQNYSHMITAGALDSLSG